MGELKKSFMNMPKNKENLDSNKKLLDIEEKLQKCIQATQTQLQEMKKTQSKVDEKLDDILSHVKGKKRKL